MDRLWGWRSASAPTLWAIGSWRRAFFRVSRAGHRRRPCCPISFCLQLDVRLPLPSLSWLAAPLGGALPGDGKLRCWSPHACVAVAVVFAVVADAAAVAVAVVAVAAAVVRGCRRGRCRCYGGCRRGRCRCCCCCRGRCRCRSLSGAAVVVLSRALPLSLLLLRALPLSLLLSRALPLSLLRGRDRGRGLVRRSCLLS